MGFGLSVFNFPCCCFLIVNTVRENLLVSCSFSNCFNYVLSQITQSWLTNSTGNFVQKWIPAFRISMLCNLDISSLCSRWFLIWGKYVDSSSCHFTFTLAHTFSLQLCIVSTSTCISILFLLLLVCYLLFYLSCYLFSFQHILSRLMDKAIKGK